MKFGLLPEDEYVDAPVHSERYTVPDFQYCRGESVEQFINNNRLPAIRESQTGLLDFMQRARVAGFHGATEFLAGLERHMAAFSFKSEPTNLAPDVEVQVPNEPFKERTITFTPQSIVKSPVQRTHRTDASFFGTPEPGLHCSTPMLGSVPDFAPRVSLIPAEVADSDENGDVERSLKRLMDRSHKTSDVNVPAVASDSSAKLEDLKSAPSPTFSSVPQTQQPTTSHHSLTAKSKVHLPVIEENDEPVSLPISETQPSWSLDYYSQFVKKRMNFDKRIDAFKETSELDSRALIKRSIVEKITINTKLKSPKEETEALANYFVALFKGVALSGSQSNSLKLEGAAEVSYSMCTMIDHYIKLAEQDIKLCPVIAHILVFVSDRAVMFLEMLLGKLFICCELLSFDIVKLNERVEWMNQQSPDSRSFFLNQQVAALRLFFLCHLDALENNVEIEGLQFKNIWRMAAFIANSKLVPLATPIVLKELFRTCGSKFKELYGKSASKLISCIQEDLVYNLEEDVLANKELQRAGQATHVSALRTTIDYL